MAASGSLSERCGRRLVVRSNRPRRKALTCAASLRAVFPNLLTLGIKVLRAPEDALLNNRQIWLLKKHTKVWQSE